jgi:hypothetical protein
MLKGKQDKTQAFAIQVATGVWVCMRCGTSGKLDRLTSWPEPEELAAQLSELEKSAREPPPNCFPLWAGPGATADLLEGARAYLRKRKLKDSMWEPAQLQACPSGPYAGRVVVPLLADDRKSWLGWVGRDWTKLNPRKYTNPGGMARERLLYNGIALQVETDEPVYVVEGVFDALAHWPNSVALLGMATGMQVEMLVNAKRPVVVVLDGDAYDHAWALAQQLRFEGQRAGAVRLPPKKDPDEVDSSWLWDEARASLTEP